MSEMKTLNGYEIVDGWARDEISRIRDESDNPTDDKYFDIDASGVISLKPQYRGRPADSKYPLSVSDNGVGIDGSQIDELPRRIVLPSHINGKAVTGFADGMFSYNYAVEEIVFPDTIKVIPRGFCRFAMRLESIKNTEHIAFLKDQCFCGTRIKEAIFPNLEELGNTANDRAMFNQCALLHTVDIGNKTTALPFGMFRKAEKLATVIGGENLTNVGAEAFLDTHDLKTLPFLSKAPITSIGNRAFFSSRIQFDWASLTGCTLGGNATPVADNTTDYWSRAIGNRYYTPCENRLVTKLHQRHPLWANETYGNSTDIFTNGEDLMTIMHIHSAITGKKYTSPLEFVDEIRAKVTGTEYADVLNSMPNERAEIQKLLRDVLGYEITCYDAYGGTALNEAAFKDILDSLADGAYVYISASSVKSSTAYPNDGLAVMAYGINEIGEVMILDSLSIDYSVMVYEATTYQIPFQNITGPNSDIIIVRGENRYE